MADSPEIPKKTGWKKVTKTFQIQGGSKRGAAAITINEYGSAETNTGAGGLVDGTAVARGIDPTKNYLVAFMVDELRGMIGIHAVDTATPGTTQIRRFKKGRISFHLGAAFAEAPSLRPNLKKVQCLVNTELDENGLPIVVIPIKAAIAKATQSRDSSGSPSKPQTPTPGSQSAASEEP